MENRELLYQAEYKVNELRKKYLCNLEYTEDLRLRDVLDMGFNNTYLRLGDHDYVCLGYKEIDKNGENGGYYSSDLGYLTDRQLDCRVKYYNDDIDDYNYVVVDVELVYEEDKWLFCEV